MLLLLLVTMLLHLELLGLLGLHHPHLGVLHLLLRHAASADALAHGRSRHHTPTAGSRHAAETASPSPLGAGEWILALAKGQVLLPGGLLLVADEAVDDPTVGRAAGAHPRRAQAGPTCATGASSTSTHAAGTTGSATRRRRVGRDVVKVRGRLGHHTGGWHTAVAIGGSTTTSSAAATATPRHAQSNHGLELSDAIVTFLDLSLELGNLYDICDDE